MSNISFEAALFFNLEDYFATIADFNGDGIGDRATINESDSTQNAKSVAIALGRDDGTFGNETFYLVRGRSLEITTADFNNDNNLDIATNTSLLLGNGDGTFIGSPVFPIENNTGAFGQTNILTADFNNDGIVDAVTNSPTVFRNGQSIPGFASVSIGTENGIFEDAVKYNIENADSAIAIGDFNGDGDADLASIDIELDEIITSSLIGRGDGTFDPEITAEFENTGSLVTELNASLTALDFDGDGFEDLIFNNADYTSVFLSNGDGTFSEPTFAERVLIPLDGSSPTAIDGDGVLALSLRSNDDNFNLVSILLSDGEGITIGQNLTTVDTGDFNGDGIADLVIRNGLDSITIVEGRDDGTFIAARDIELPDAAAYSINVGDLDGDGIQDIVVGTNGNLITLQGTGDGNFTFSQSIPEASFFRGSTTLTDLENDGDLDVLSVTEADVIALLNDGTGNLQDTPTLDVAGTQSYAVTSGDFNGDGIADLAVAEGNVSILLSNGDGSFAEPIVENITNTSTAVTTTDVNGDRILDLVVTSSENVDPRSYGDNGKVSLLLGNGDGSFADEVVYDLGGGVRSLTTGDVNQDNITDIVVGSSQNRDAVSVLLGNADGTFNDPVDYNANLGSGNIIPFTDNSVEIELNDFDGDGFVDIITGNSQSVSGDVIVLRGNGDGTFIDTPTAIEQFNNNDLSLADFNDDENLDIFVDNSIRFGNGDGTFDEAITPIPVEPYSRTTYSINAAEDFNGDGFDDIVVRRSSYAGAPFYDSSYGSILFGNGDGTFGNEIELSSYSNPDAAIGDFNGDGFADVAISDNVYVFNDGYFQVENSRISLLLNNNDGTFRDVVRTEIRSRNSILVVADLNNDEIDDVVTQEAVHLADGDGTFSEPILFDEPLASPPISSGNVTAAAGDFNGDGNIDLATADTAYDRGDRVSILLGNGNGTFSEGVSLSVSLGISEINVSDYNNDAIADLSVSNDRENSVSVFQGNGNGTFQNAVKFAAGDGASDLATGDLNNNGSQDLLVVNQFSSDVSVLLNNNTTTPVNTPPEATTDSFNTDENQIITGNVLTNDSDAEGDSLVVTSIDGNSDNIGTQITLASGVLLTLNSNGTFSYDPNSVFDDLDSGETASDSFTYTISDGNGGSDTATVNITINGVGNMITGTTGNDTLNGTSGDDIFNSIAGNDLLRGFGGNDLLEDEIGSDTLIGGNGNDTLISGGDNDRLRGGNGDDVLDGGEGNDTLIGGGQSDRFILRNEEGTDTIRDYRDGIDKLVLAGGLEFADIAIVQQVTSTQIQVIATGEVLTDINSVTANFLDESDFKIVD